MLTMFRSVVPWLLGVEVASTLFMTGLIWFVQIVHYPLFALVGESSTDYQRAHMKRTTWVVAVPMLAELASATSLALLGIGPDWKRWPAVALLAVIWLATAMLLVPSHDHLAQGFSASVHRRLVWSNWIRTVAWTGRAALCVAAYQLTIR